MIPLSAIARVFNLPSTRNISTSSNLLNKSRSTRSTRYNSNLGSNNDNDNDDYHEFYYISQMDQIDYPEMNKVSGRYKIITNSNEKRKPTRNSKITYDEHYYLTFTI